MITFWIGRNSTVWLNEAWTASELLDMRAGTSSSRPLIVVFGELGAGQESLLSIKFRVDRKLTHMAMGLQQVRNYQGLQGDENRIVLYDLARDPEHFVQHLERYAASVVSIIGFGRRVVTNDDHTITEVIAVAIPF